MEFWHEFEGDFWAALLGAVAGGGFALAGAWMQGRHARRLARQQLRDRQREAWFMDLRRVYEDVGRHYSRIVAAFETFVHTSQQTARTPDFAENLHANMLLHMHGASDDVLAASDTFIATDNRMLKLVPGQATTADLSQLTNDLGDFYSACGAHLDEVWPTGDTETPWWKFWRS